MEMEWQDLAIKGFTLIEVLFATLIASAVMLAITGMFIFGGKGIYGGRKSLLAVEGTGTQMESLLNLSMDRSGSGKCATISFIKGLECKWSIRKDIPEPGLSTIEVISRWNEGDRERTYILRTLRWRKD